MTAPSSTQFDAIVELVRDVARSEILPGFRQFHGMVSTKTAPTDLVTEYDRKAEAAIARGLATILPQAAIIGEEAVSAAPELLRHLDDEGTVVVVDPIDGTWNYAAGIAVFGVLVSVVQAGRTIFGLLYDPLCDDWVRVEAGAGAWFYTDAAKAGRRLSIGSDLAHRGFVPHRLADFGPLYAALPDHTRLTSLGCSCHEYRSVVLGHADFLFSSQPSPWDHLAGVLAVTEAGGSVRPADLLDGWGQRQLPLIAARNEEMVERVSTGLADITWAA